MVIVIALGVLSLVAIAAAIYNLRIDGYRRVHARHQ